MVYLSRPYHFKFFKGCLPQIVLVPFLNTLSHLFIPWDHSIAPSRYVKKSCATIYLFFGTIVMDESKNEVPLKTFIQNLNIKECRSRGWASFEIPLFNKSLNFCYIKKK